MLQLYMFYKNNDREHNLMQLVVSQEILHYRHKVNHFLLIYLNHYKLHNNFKSVVQPRRQHITYDNQTHYRFLCELNLNLKLIVKVEIFNFLLKFVIFDYFLSFFGFQQDLCFFLDFLSFFGIYNNFWGFFIIFWGFYHLLKFIIIFCVYVLFLGIFIIFWVFFQIILNFLGF